MIKGTEFAAELEAAGFDFFTGVPCSLVEDVIAALEAHPRLPYVPAVREDVGVGLAAGAWLAGKRPAVLLQNSGLGTSLNALVSLSIMYRLPVLLVVTWRGHEGRDAPEHIQMGQITPRLLDLLSIPQRVAAAESLPADIGWARAEADRLSQPVALVVPPGVVETGHHGGHGGDARPAGGAAPGRPADLEAGRALPAPGISRFAALRAALAAVGDAPVVHANGYICRESFSITDRPQNFYMIGSMGLASAIGLGVALARPETPTVVFDGDGNLLMNLGILPMIGGGPLMGRGRPGHFVHVVFDNEVYGSTGDQASPSRHTRLDRLAHAAGYESAEAFTSEEEIGDAVARALRRPGPSFVLAKVTAEEHEAPRIPYAPEEITGRFRRALRDLDGPRNGRTS
ncbi:MAG TPA: thiamine pyrophosphate-dependent enzyme [Candidatus Limnocylindrales bacterium]|nr:thiamine pyrophosphate-dependent enzyme [Candidatus Limnocylindrales bacterium]